MSPREIGRNPDQTRPGEAERSHTSDDVAPGARENVDRPERRSRETTDVPATASEVSLGGRARDAPDEVRSVRDVVLEAHRTALESPHGRQKMEELRAEGEDVSGLEAGFSERNYKPERIGHVDLYRGFKVANPIDASRLRGDFGLSKDVPLDTIVPGQDPSRDDEVKGMSVYLNPDEARITGPITAKSERSTLHPDLGIVADGGDVGGEQPDGHHTVYNKRDSTFGRILEMLAEGWSDVPVGRKKDQDGEMLPREGYARLVEGRDYDS